MKRLLASLFIYLFTITGDLSAQNDQIDLLNEVIGHLIGEQDVESIPSFESMHQVCSSSYISCNKKSKIVGLNFQFANLNGVIPESITQLEDLEWINLEYNYLSGTIPSGFSKMTKLEELLLNGNFLVGPVPEDLMKLSRRTLVDLSKNAIKSDNQRMNTKLQIKDQVNLEGCRSPDSIFISKIVNNRVVLEPQGISIDIDEIEARKLELEERQKNKQGEDDLTEKEIFKEVEQMPRFPGCEDLDAPVDEKTSCAVQKLLQFIYGNLRYPEIARAMGLEGMCVVQFVILKNGNVADVMLVRDPAPGGRLGNSSQWVVNRMNYLCDPWTPGIQGGNPVKVMYTLPIKYKLE